MKVLIFVGLKVVEIAALVFVPYWIGNLGRVKKYWRGENNSWGSVWFTGLLTLVIGGAMIFIGFMLVMANWKWAGKLLP